MKIPPVKRMMNQYFDHWRMAIKMKKLMRYHLNKCNNQVMPIKCDLMQAFRKWKNSDFIFQNYLDRTDKLSLQVKN